MNLIILVGPAGSGKSTLAKQYIEQGYEYVSQDMQGKEGHRKLFDAAMTAGQNICIDRMNFNREQRARYINPAKELGYSVKIITLFVPYEICLDRCLNRHGHPTINGYAGRVSTRVDPSAYYVDTFELERQAKSALQTFFTKFERPTSEEGEVEFKYYECPNKQPGFIVDLDGTLCNIDHRLHFVKREGKKDWKGFFDGISDDVPNEWCLELVTALNDKNYIPVFCSGRPDSYRKQTKEWLQKYVHGLYCAEHLLYMRHRNDHRSDDIAKEIILDFELLPRYNILFAVDDRQRVVDLWRRRGIVALQCSHGDF